MTDAERREAARQFCQRWANKGKEDEDARSYWIEFLQEIIGMEEVTKRVDFEKKVIGPDGNTKRIDAYIPETRVLIEQKSLGIALDKPQQGHNGMTPYEQAKMYDNSLPFDEKSRWIIVSNFAEIWVYDLNEKKPEPKKFILSDIQSKYSLFEFLINKKQQKISQEMEVSIEAGKFVGLIYDAFLKQYINPENEESLKSLNMLCVRLVFCLYAEDAHIFGNNGHMFHDYMDQFETKDMRKALIELFKILDTPEKNRDPYDDSLLAQFPYVNGGLFADESIEIPRFTEEIRDILLSKASEGFDWSKISPT
ncbi:MAG: methylase, partial [Lachnospiraceae bacterium]|nr:methylase [Lachnospiraceae bacterium]